MSNSNTWDGKGEPGIGQFARVLINPARPASESLKKFAGLDVEVINKFYYDGDLIVVIHNLDCGHKSISTWGNYLTPIKSEREIAIEEICRVLGVSLNSKTAQTIYDAGYRKVEVR